MYTVLSTQLITGRSAITGYSPPTLRNLATSYLDICSVPRRSFFEILKHFSTDDQHIEKFNEFCTREGQEELWDYTTRPRRTINEVLADFWSSLTIPLEYVLDVFPAMKPRRFSIASSLKVNFAPHRLCRPSV
jgi:sulfite reductase alpha subunit-like flavoprotein